MFFKIYNSSDTIYDIIYEKYYKMSSFKIRNKYTFNEWKKDLFIFSESILSMHNIISNLLLCKRLAVPIDTLKKSITWNYVPFFKN